MSPHRLNYFLLLDEEFEGSAMRHNQPRGPTVFRDLLSIQFQAYSGPLVLRKSIFTLGDAITKHNLN